MSAKPSKLPRWATTAGRTVEPAENGTTVATKDFGWKEGKAVPARKMNWLFNIIYQWLVWLDILYTQDFKAGGSAGGKWTGDHYWTKTTTHENGIYAQAALNFPVIVANGLGTGVPLTLISANARAIYAECYGDPGVYGIEIHQYADGPAAYFSGASNGADIEGLSGYGLSAQSLGGGGSGVIGAGHAGGWGGDFTGGISGSGVRGTAGTAGNGRGGSFTGYGSGAGVYGAGGTGIGWGGEFHGATSGGGVWAQAGQTGNGTGLVAEGHGTGQGASITGGANGSGADITAGGGDNYGAKVTASGSGTGLIVEGGATGRAITATGHLASYAIEAVQTESGYAIHASRSNAPTTQKPTIRADGWGDTVDGPALEVYQAKSTTSAAIAILQGTIYFGGGGPAKNADVGYDGMLCGALVTKAWGSLKIQASNAGLVNEDGINFASCTLVGTTQIQVTFARAVANAVYAVDVSAEYIGGVQYDAVWLARTTTGFKIMLLNSATGAPLNLTTTSVDQSVTFKVTGRQ